MQRSTDVRGLRRMPVLTLILLAVLGSLIGGKASPALGFVQSVNVVIIGGTTLDLNSPCVGNTSTDANVMFWTGGGCLPVTGPPGELGDFTFAPMAPSAVSAANLAPFDTAVLNVASSAMQCNTNTLSAQQQADLIAFIEAGHKLIIYDSECAPAPVDYNWLPFPFITSNPGAQGAQGTLTIVEENTLSSNDPTSPFFIDANDLSLNTDAVGDMNVMTTFDPNWFIDMSGTNILGVTGPVHTYANFPVGTDTGLIIYNGLDQDYQYSFFANSNLRKIWVQELQQQFNPAELPGSVAVIGITLKPPTDANAVGEDHTVTATLTDQLGIPQPGILVTFSVFSGPNAGASGTCSPNADCTTDANGEVSFTYTGAGGEGTDDIEACFTNEAGQEVCAQATKEWTPPPFIEVPVDVKPTSCRNPFNVNQGYVLPVAILGTADFDVTHVDPGTVLLGSVAPLRWSLEDVATPYEPFIGKVDAFDCTDEGPDGSMDLTLKFSAQEVVSDLGAVNDGNVLVLPLTGFLKPEYGGTQIVGEDVIVILER